MFIAVIAIGIQSCQKATVDAIPKVNEIGAEQPKVSGDGTVRKSYVGYRLPCLLPATNCYIHPTVYVYAKYVELKALSLQNPNDVKNYFLNPDNSDLISSLTQTQVSKILSGTYQILFNYEDNQLINFGFGQNLASNGSNVEFAIQYDK